MNFETIIVEKKDVVIVTSAFTVTLIVVWPRGYPLQRRKL
jgi:hypothetical protein